MSGINSPLQNRLLAGLPLEVSQRLIPQLKHVALVRNKALYESGEMTHHVFFPTDAIVSLLYETDDGTSTEVSMVGNDGAIGFAMFLGGESTHSRAVVQMSGNAYLLTRQQLIQEFNHNSALKRSLLCYTLSLITQMSLTAVCNRFHTINQQLSRWLLEAQDRVQRDSFNITHDQVAQMLGVRREGVTVAACKLQRQGIISYHRGRVTVVDRPRLEAQSCECYQVVRRESDRLLNNNCPVHPPASSRTDPRRDLSRAALR
ncbi:MAG: Crp/Fnr family transcriptional regulator [Pseudohongiellaceae bacterium]